MRFYPEEYDLYLAHWSWAMPKGMSIWVTLCGGGLLAILRNMRKTHRKGVVTSPVRLVEDGFHKEAEEVLEAKEGKAGRQLLTQPGQRL